jgi:ubiquinone/menaquinone biosynthesis C-methylase UbiE
MNSQNLHKEFNENPELWETYHEISEENEKLFPENEIPRNRIMTELDKIKTKRSKSVVDMGCGKAHISKHFKKDKRFTFTNLDHYSSDDTITSCDILNTGLEDDSTEICILSLAMWGSNCREYIEEAYRILETNGTLYIIEPTKRWSEKDELGNITNEPGMKLKNLLEENNFRINERNIEKFSLFICRKC